MDSVLIGAAVGAVVGGIVGAIMMIVRVKKVKAAFNIQKGMGYQQIIDILGAPMSEKQRGQKVTCRWIKMINGKTCNVTIVFVNGVVKNFG